MAWTERCWLFFLITISISFWGILQLVIGRKEGIVEVLLGPMFFGGRFLQAVVVGGIVLLGAKVIVMLVTGSVWWGIGSLVLFGGVLITWSLRIPQGHYLAVKFEKE